MDGWTRDLSPFHEGEQAIQSRMGVRERVERQGRRVIREFMPDQHRQFYSQLPFLVVGSVDGNSQPWASIVAGAMGFITSPDPQTLIITAQPLSGDPLQQTLQVGADIGLLGIELGTRRRNRMNGLVTEITPHSFTIRVTQAFGNCPQYIQKRQVQFVTRQPLSSVPVTPQAALNEVMKSVMRQADTLFIASHYSKGDLDPTYGVDVSHRGGKPGFICIDDEKTLLFPDFAGNLHFNTVGNLVLDPGVGLLVPNFETGDIVTLTGQAEIIWEGELLQAFEGAERLFRIRIDEVVYLPQRLPLQTQFEEYSPSLDHTGSWSDVAHRLQLQANDYRTFAVTQVDVESDQMRSFYLQPTDGQVLMGYEAGQSLPIRYTPPGQQEPSLGCCPLSEASGQDYYRISISPDQSPLAANLYESAQVGTELEAQGPQGSFTLDHSNRPVVLISSAAGIAPMIAMLNQIKKQVDCCGIDRQTWFIHVTQTSETHAFADYVRQLTRYYDHIRATFIYTNPLATDAVGQTYDHLGPLTLSWLMQHLPSEDYEFYLSGPQPDLQLIYQGLQESSIPSEQIHYQLE